MYGHLNRPDSQTPRPPEPEWRLPPAHRPLQSQSAPPHPPGASYNPAAFRSISNPSGTGQDTTAWGVRYNQQQQQLLQTPPPVPPRPSDTNEQPYAHAQSRSQSQSPANKPLPPAPLQLSADTPIAWSTTSPPPYTPLPAINPVPVPPPKIPQDGDQHTKQSGPPAQPALLSQGSGPAAMTGSYGFPHRTSHSAPTSASALGRGTPSDWEHLGPTPGDFEDGEWFPARRNSPSPSEQTVLTPPGYTNSPACSEQTVLTPPGYTTGIPNVALTSQSFVSLPTTDSGPCQSPVSELGRILEQGIPFSPVSPTTVQGRQTPPSLVRVNTGSSSAYSPSSLHGRSESIDGLIEALVRPRSHETETLSPTGEQTTPRLNSQSAVKENSPVEAPTPAQPGPSFERGAQTGSHARTPSTELKENTIQTKIPAPDPYEDLDPWFRSSLARFVTMLRKEAVADSDEERYKIFTAFMAKETKLREILYNMELGPQDMRSSRRASVQTTQQSSPKSDDRSPSKFELIPVESEDAPLSAQTPFSAQTPTSAQTLSGDEGDDGGSEYSAGGRPMQAKRAHRSSHGLQTLPSVGEDKDWAGFSRPVSVPPLMGDVQKQAFEPLNTNPPRPIYTPFQYTEGPQRGSDNLKFDRPAYEAYHRLRRASAVSGRVMSYTPAPLSRPRSTTLTGPAQNEHDETFLGLIRDKSGAYRTSSGPNTTPPSMLPEPLRQARPSNLVEELRTIVWAPLDTHSESSWHRTICEELEKLPDDFSYIQAALSNWEKAAQPRRQKLDRERMARQEESEAQIDDLFNEKEIGYADINTLEDEFRQTEARVQLDEERREVDEFTTHVFNPLDERLKDEISVLRKAYDAALSQLDRDQKGKTSLAEQRSPSVTMRMVNDIHNKLEIRFQKRLELALDCERRRKKAERRPLVFMGDTLGLRQLDGDFDRMERRNLFEAAKDRDDRANRLMDSFDDAILHGLGMNQHLLDGLASKVAQLEPTTLHASDIPDSEVEQILKSAATFAASLRADSEAILRSFGVADMALNDADYSVSVAEARYANSDPDVFRRLDAEKRKEDTKIQSDLDSKLQSIQKSPADIEETIQRLLYALAEASPGASSAELKGDTTPASRPAALPVPDSRPSTASSLPMPGDRSGEELEHQERMQKALEAAKKRNEGRKNP